MGDYSVGLIDMQTGGDDRQAVPASHFTVARIRRDILRKSSVGAIYTRRSQMLDGHIVHDYTVAGWISALAEPLVLAVSLLLSAAYWRTRRARMATDALALLALLLLVRCMLDPLSISYHNAPFAIALASWEGLSRRGVPYVTVLVSAAILPLLSRSSSASQARCRPGPERSASHWSRADSGSPKLPGAAEATASKPVTWPSTTKGTVSRDAAPVAGSPSASGMFPAAARSRRSPSSSGIIANAASAPTATRADSTAPASSRW